MIIGVPREIKDHEYRVSLTPAAVGELVAHGHTVLVESHAGEGSGFFDSDYGAVGGQIVPTAADAWAAPLVVKVKEPTPAEYGFFREGLALFTFLHLAADARLMQELVARGVRAIAYETVELANGHLPLLTPMSEIAGRLSIQAAATYLEKRHGGCGKLLGGVPGVLPAEVVVLGGGVVGTNAAQMALGLGASVTVVDRDVERLRYLEHVLHGRLRTLVSTRAAVAAAVAAADVLIGAVLVKGARAPRLVTREMVATMRAGSVIVDVAIDQGGCVETARVTTHSAPVFVDEGVVHYGVSNMPAVVPRTSTIALGNVTLPYVLKLAHMGVAAAVAADEALARGVNIWDGEVRYAALVADRDSDG